MIQFYSPDIETTESLPESESAHCCRVLRLDSGDRIYVTDGKGKRFECTITSPGKDNTYVSIDKVHEVPNHWDFDLTLAVAPTKHTDRMEWLLEKAVEIGVNRIVLVRCRRSERKQVKPERLLKVMVSAMKQSLKCHLPLLETYESLQAFVKGLSSDAQKFMGYCSDEFERREFVKTLMPQGKIVILIGPEGDFTPEEVDYAVSAGFCPVTFGDTRLRTETAALYGVASVHAKAMLEKGN